MINNIVLKKIGIPFKAVFKHSSAARAATTSLWTEAYSNDGVTGYGESCPREYVTKESLESAREFFLLHKDALVKDVYDIASLRTWVTRNKQSIDDNPAAWCAMELAMLDLIAKENLQSVDTALAVPEVTGKFKYSAVLGDADEKTFRSQLERYLQLGLTDFKLKLSGDLSRDQKKMEILRNVQHDINRLRVDANNLWERPQQAIDYLKALNHPFFAIEEPLQANRFPFPELAKISKSLRIKIILDESFLRLDQFADLGDQPDLWIINLRVSKMGGLLRSIAIVEKARETGIKLIIGAQVGETSLLTRAALSIANIARDLLIAQEGAFGTLLLTSDVCEPPIMFKAAGILDVSDFLFPNSAGFGLNIAETLPFIADYSH